MYACRSTKEKTASLALLLLLIIFFGIRTPELKAAGPDCRIDAGPCVQTSGALSVGFDVSPKPLKAMRELTFIVTVEEKGKPVTNASLLINLSMPGMYMGKNIVRLAHRVDGIYEGTGVIVRCPSGEKIWQASTIH